jgi:superfamily I DNA and/or RNA helicase
MIVADAISRGLRVAVTANSHKVITNMLAKAANLLPPDSSCGIVKIGGSCREEAEHIGSKARGVVGASNLKLNDEDMLIGATAWALANNNVSSCVDLLIVDEAGQVPICRLPAMGKCLKPGGKIVVLGDQMQLPAPVQGTHPGQGDKSILEYILSGDSNSESVIDENRGIFLPLSFRMHPSICNFISSQVYGGKLNAHPHNANRHLVLNPPLCSDGAETRLVRVEHGVTVVPVSHDFNTVTSEEEVDTIVQIVKELCDPSQTMLSVNGDSRPLTIEDILVVSPFNLQVLPTFFINKF